MCLHGIPEVHSQMCAYWDLPLNPPQTITIRVLLGAGKAVQYDDMM